MTMSRLVVNDAGFLLTKLDTTSPFTNPDKVATWILSSTTVQVFWLWLTVLLVSIFPIPQSTHKATGIIQITIRPPLHLHSTSSSLPTCCLFILFVSEGEDFTFAQNTCSPILQ
ncbi:hypothetical protein RvY_17120-2 [Ramazzottius varieornatus]|uniref:Uncharacterized protein n=1 Tax=Ramazzottius varieornatus TaxID=947166 RepID=A0A1D1W105_RAMVA|nr:hypothetical protein RvY_17120-2 [Ramazzottius varieornatus]